MGSKTVLIIGAGPTGLTVGIELARRGVEIRLVDKRPGPLTTSRAFTLHARTMEAFDVMGVAEGVQNLSLHTISMDYHFVGPSENDEIRHMKLDFSSANVRGRHPGICTIPQTATERVLRECFCSKGCTIEWDTELQSFSEMSTGKVMANLARRGTTESASFDYMVACDGARSLVRKALNVEFSGLCYTGTTLKMMDVPLNDTMPVKLYPEYSYHYFIKQQAMVLFAKMGTVEEYNGIQDVWRVLVSTKEESPDTSLKAFQADVDKVLPAVQLGSPIWTTSYRIHKRLASAYSSDSGRIFLAGDAAHINSPAGGQGMNTAIQDGFNLGWKLALVCRGLCKPDLLLSYEKERRPIATDVLEGTDLLHSVIMAHGKGLSDRIALASAEGWGVKAVMRISGQSFTCEQDICLTRIGKDVVQEQPGNNTIVLVGQSAPDVVVSEDSRADQNAHQESEALRLSTVSWPFYLVLFLDGRYRHENVISSLPETARCLIRVVHAVKSDLSSAMDKILLQQYGNASAAIIRPDRYICDLFPADSDLDDIVNAARRLAWNLLETEGE